MVLTSAHGAFEVDVRHSRLVLEHLDVTCSTIAEVPSADRHVEIKRVSTFLPKHCFAR